MVKITKEEVYDIIHSELWIDIMNKLKEIQDNAKESYLELDFNNERDMVINKAISLQTKVETIKEIIDEINSVIIDITKEGGGE